jgi:LemA protein
MRLRESLILLAAVTGLAGCGYNALQQEDENVKSALSEVLNQYQRRNDLIPNLVAAAHGVAIQEASVLAAVAEARARVVAIPVTPRLVSDTAALGRLQDAQAELTNALKRLLRAAELSPQLRADANFQDLQRELAQSQTRITSARDRYLAAVRRYNLTVRQFPTSLTARVFEFNDKG